MKTFRRIGVFTLTLFLLIVAIFLLYALETVFDFATARYPTTTIDNIINMALFYGRGQIQWATLTWYGVSFPLLWLLLKAVHKLPFLTWQAILKTGTIAILLAPTVLVLQADQHPFFTILIPHIRGIDIGDVTILPAWVTMLQIQKFFCHDPIDCTIMHALSFWQISGLWGLLLLASTSSHKDY